MWHSDGVLEEPADGTYLLYEDDHDGPPGHPAPSGSYVTDDFGDRVAGQNLLWREDPADGSFRLLWLPTRAIPPAAPGGFQDEAASGVALEVVTEVDRNLVLVPSWEVYRTRLAVETGEPLPDFDDRPNGQYVDGHVHTVAEWYHGSALLGPAKAYGGPLPMLLASAWALGFIDEPTAISARDRIITTDHNTFFDDEDAPGAGWTDPALGPYGTPRTGSPEQDIMLQWLGEGVGEEVSVDGALFDGDALARTGRHALVYRAAHIEGDWGIDFDVLPDPIPGLDNCTPSPSNVLSRLACNPGEPGECGGSAPCLDRAGATDPPFAFAAHPFVDGFQWPDDLLREALDLPGARDPDQAARYWTEDDEAVFRGYQFWNSRATRSRETSVRTLGDLDPFSMWASDCTGGEGGGYRDLLEAGVARFLLHVRDGLAQELREDPPPEHPTIGFRKLFHVAGSDAHGDFNYTTDLCSTLAATAGPVDLCGRGPIPASSVSDSAFGRPRSWTLGDVDDALVLDDLRAGRSVATDGPLLEVRIDPEGRWLPDPHGEGAWTEDSLSDPLDPFDVADAAALAEGRIGGSGPRDGGRTALVPFSVEVDEPDVVDDRSQRPVVFVRCNNIDDFGGDDPSLLELIVVDPDRYETIDLLSHAPGFTCDGEWEAIPLDLGTPEDRGALVESTAIMAHLRTGSGGCVTEYDAYTNPVWLAPVEVSAPLVVVRPEEGGFFVSHEDTRHAIELTFPISMADQPVRASLALVHPTTGEHVPLTGGTDDQGGLEVVVEVAPGEYVPLSELPSDHGEGWGWQDAVSEGGPRHHRLALRVPEDAALEGDLDLADVADPGFILLIERDAEAAGPPDDPDSPCDGVGLCGPFGNPLGTLAARIRPEPIEAVYLVTATLSDSPALDASAFRFARSRGGASTTTESWEFFRARCGEEGSNCEEDLLVYERSSSAVGDTNPLYVHAFAWQIPRLEGVPGPTYTFEGETYVFQGRSVSDLPPGSPTFIGSVEVPQRALTNLYLQASSPMGWGSWNPVPASHWASCGLDVVSTRDPWPRPAPRCHGYALSSAGWDPIELDVLRELATAAAGHIASPGDRGIGPALHAVLAVPPAPNSESELPGVSTPYDHGLWDLSDPDPDCHTEGPCFLTWATRSVLDATVFLAPRSSPGAGALGCPLELGTSDTDPPGWIGLGFGRFRELASGELHSNECELCGDCP